MTYDARLIYFCLYCTVVLMSDSSFLTSVIFAQIISFCMVPFLRLPGLDMNVGDFDQEPGGAV